MVEGDMSSLKTAVIAAFVGTPVAPLARLVELTEGAEGAGVRFSSFPLPPHPAISTTSSNAADNK
jgi:hypothetical protein